MFHLRCILTNGLILNRKSTINSLTYTKKFIYNNHYNNLTLTQLSKFSSDVNIKKDKDSHIINVYTGELSTHIRLIKSFSLMSSALGLGSQPVLYSKIAMSESPYLFMSFCGFLGVFSLVTPFLLHFLTRKYVTAIDFNEETDSYIAKTKTIFVTTKKVHFVPEDVYISKTSSIFNTVIIKDKGYLIDFNKFKNPIHAAKIMGLDKPVDFEMDLPSEKK